MGFVGPCKDLGSFSHKNDRVSCNGGGVVLKRRGRLRVIRGKFQRLQRLIPGGEGLKPRQLMAHTAHYIVHLEMQLRVLEALLKLHHVT